MGHICPIYNHLCQFHMGVIHQTLTWTTGSLTRCIRDHSYACVYTQGLGKPTASQHNKCYSEKRLTTFSSDPDGVRISGLSISSPTLYQLSHLVKGETGTGRESCLRLRTMQQHLPNPRSCVCITRTCHLPLLLCQIMKSTCAIQVDIKWTGWLSQW